MRSGHNVKALAVPLSLSGGKPKNAASFAQHCWFSRAHFAKTPVWSSPRVVGPSCSVEQAHVGDSVHGFSGTRLWQGLQRCTKDPPGSVPEAVGSC